MKATLCLIWLACLSGNWRLYRCFTLGGRTSQERQNIELTGSFTASVDAELVDTTLAEVITVNASIPVVLTYNNAFVPNGPWLQPLTILTPRSLRVSADVDF